MTDRSSNSMMVRTVGPHWLSLLVLTLAMSTPLSSATAEESLDAELRCSSDEVRSAVEAVDREQEKDGGINPQVGLVITQKAIELCPEAISLANQRFEWVTRLEDPSDRQILAEFERVARAFELASRGIVPGAFRRPVEYLTAHGLEVGRCVEFLGYALTKIREYYEGRPWGRISEDKAAKMVQIYRISQADTLVLMVQAHLALDSPEEAEEVAERIYALALDIESGPDLGASKHLSFKPQYWILRGQIAEATGDLANAFEFYQRAESFPEYERRWQIQSKRIWLLMGGVEDD